MKDSELLKKVKSEYQTDFGMLGLCSIIKSTAFYVDQDQGSSLRRWIISMLGENLMLQGWLYKHGHITLDECRALSGDASKFMEKHGSKRVIELREKLKQTRLAWLDWMIDYCEKGESNAPNNTKDSVAS